MSGSSFGRLFTVTSWGESHGKAIGVTVDGCPAGLALTEADVQPYLDRRRPGQSRYTTKRAEADTVEILSGTFNGLTTGTPISMIVRNNDQHSKDYSDIANVYRPGHADYGYDVKYGFRDYRGGGRSSGRETISRVAAGAVAIKLLESLGISIHAYAKEIGGIECTGIDLSECANNPFYMPDAAAAAKVMVLADEQIAACDSLGGIVECVASNVPAGAGDPVFCKLDAELGQALFSIGAVKGVEIGDGFAAARSRGSVNNDAFTEGFGKATDHAGGILGGISDGSDIIMRAAIKPTPSIARPQQTVNSAGEPVTITIRGRHDPMIVPRAVVVVESMAAITIADALLCGMSARLSGVKDFWGR